MLLHIFGNLEIEARVIHQDDYIRIPLRDVFLASVHVLENGAKMEQDRNEAHIGQLPVMLHPSTPNGTHQVTPEETEVRLRILFFQGTHQVRGMQVARCLAYNQVIFHTLKSQVFNSPINE